MSYNKQLGVLVVKALQSGIDQAEVCQLLEELREKLCQCLVENGVPTSAQMSETPEILNIVELTMEKFRALIDKYKYN